MMAAAAQRTGPPNRDAPFAAHADQHCNISNNAPKLDVIMNSSARTLGALQVVL